MCARARVSVFTHLCLVEGIEEELHEPRCQQCALCRFPWMRAPQLRLQKHPQRPLLVFVCAPRERQGGWGRREGGGCVTVANAESMSLRLVKV